jgi:hypothetical protein
VGDADYWKRLYQQAWDKSDRREREIIRRIHEETGNVAIPVGLGAGSTEFFSGTASSQGYERGGADLHVVETNVYLEVTGPQTASVGHDEPLWIRPDKAKNAFDHRHEHETWVVHWLEKDGTLRVIHMGDGFFANIRERVFPIVERTIRGARERYVEIPAEHDFVRPWSDLIERLRSL